MNRNGENLISIGEALRILGVDRRTLWNWDKKGKLKSLRDWRGIRYFKREDVAGRLSEMKAAETLNGPF